MINYKKTTLNNGLRIIFVPDKAAKTAAVLVLTGTGSRYETKETNGISHFSEHMFFKGTKRRPSTLKIAEILDKVGGIYNAFTSKEMTGFWAKTAKEHFPLAIDFVSDIFLNSLIRSKDIEREKGVIIEEINMYLDSPQKYIGELFENVLYGNQPAAFDTIGTKENILKFKRPDFINYLKSHYSAKNTIVALAGNFHQANALKAITKTFGKMPAKIIEPKLSVNDSQEKPNLLVHFKKTDQTHLSLGVRAFGINNEKKYPTLLLAILLGGNMSSRLFINLREKAGLAYYVHTENEAYTDSGYLTTQAGVPNNKAEKAVEIILDEYKKIKKDFIKENELKKAKDYLKGSLLLGLESSDSLASFYGVQELLTDRILTIKQKCAKIDKVGKKEVFEIAAEIFDNKKLNLALIGPHKPWKPISL